MELNLETQEALSKSTTGDKFRLALDNVKSVSGAVNEVTDTVSNNLANVEADIKGYEGSWNFEVTSSISNDIPPEIPF